MFMGWVSVAFYGRRLLEFFLFLCAPELWTKREQIERKGGGKGAMDQTRTDRMKGWWGGWGWVGTGFLHYRSEWFPLWHNSGTYNFSISVLRYAV
ncbi:hypothetical protein CDAR_605771 [Caerostris darwini]|uniref:Secreted protein n=1 Tax=Caerostris darwini TaxID=1538125 RepID=A0AAV4UA72_9ARAC|nr:hypothetical protein CDAR_605771 [Caerostris darwini]